jgi:hypothetical protein
MTKKLVSWDDVALTLPAVVETHLAAMIPQAGSGAPAIAGTAGDYYFRKDTPATVGQRIYVCTVSGAAGVATWVATAA